MTSGGNQVVTLVAERRGSSIVISPVGYSDAMKTLVYREIPAARWDKTRRRWEMPGTAGSEARIVEAIPAFMRGGIPVRVDGIADRRFSGVVRECENQLPFDTASRPWRHQLRAYWFLAWARRNLGSALLDCGMRTGKTMMVLSHVAGLPADQRRGIIAAPNTVVPVWAEQAQSRVGDAVRVVSVDDGSVAYRVSEVLDLLHDTQRPTMAVVGWSVFERLSLDQKKSLRDALAGSTVVADEVHYVKSAGSARSQALAYVSREAAFRIGASGTPLSHSPLDAYGIFRFLDAGIWGTSFARFRDRYAVMGGFGNYQVTGYRNLDDMTRWIGPYTFRATRDVLDLPDAQHIDVPVRLPPSAAKIYCDLRDECVAELESGTLTAANSLARLTRLAQAASGHLPAADGSGRVEVIHQAKQTALSDLLESCDPREPWVTFSRFHYDLDAAAAAAKVAGRPHFELSGRRKELDAWRESCRAGRGPVLAAQIQSGGIGISLVEAAFCVYLSVGYSLSEWEQSLARIHGPEQTRPVAYYHIIAKGTVDVAIRRALAKRADVIRFVSDTMVEQQRQGEQP